MSVWSTQQDLFSKEKGERAEKEVGKKFCNLREYVPAIYLTSVYLPRFFVLRSFFTDLQLNMECACFKAYESDIAYFCSEHNIKY